jgi:NAD+ diphosphatase
VLADDRSLEDAKSKERTRLFESHRLPHTLPSLVFLGIDDRPKASESSVPAKVDPLEPKGVPYFALEVTDADGGEWGEARASGGAMSPWEAGIFAQARALMDWNGRNKVSLPRLN